jgi:transposase
VLASQAEGRGFESRRPLHYTYINQYVIWNHEGRGKAVLDKLYRKIGKKGCGKIQAVASDGARGFLLSSKEHLKKSLIVLDHFYVKQYLNDAVDTVRKEELRKARQQENEELSAILHYFACKITSAISEGINN